MYAYVSHVSGYMDGDSHYVVISPTPEMAGLAAIDYSVMLNVHGVGHAIENEAKREIETVSV